MGQKGKPDWVHAMDIPQCKALAPLINKRAFCHQQLREIANLRYSVDTDCSLSTAFRQGSIIFCRSGKLKQTWPNVVINKLV